MKTIKRTVFWPALFLVILWLIEWYAETGHTRWISLGIYPRTVEGLTGIFTAPFIHGGLDHLLSNSLPLLIVGTGLFYFYHQIAFRVIGLIWFLTGFWVWLAARQVTHIGASGLIYGFVCFLFFSGLIRKDTRLAAVSMLVAFVYGSMVWGILPVDQAISWESHLLGAFAGVFTAIAFRKYGPPRQKAQWEIEEEMEAANPSSNEETDVSPDIQIHYDYIEKNQADPASQDEEK